MTSGWRYQRIESEKAPNETLMTRIEAPIAYQEIVLLLSVAGS